MAKAAQDSQVKGSGNEEAERARLKREALVVKDWTKIRPRFEDSAIEREAWQLAEEWREAQTEP
jgi:hypothetical protein